jgi:parallel beta-helix repeat protein
LAHIGKYGIELAQGCRDNRIAGNHIHDMGAGGVKIGEPVIRLTDHEATSGNKVSRNHIHDLGKTYLCAVGVWIGQSGDNLVAHNHIHDLNYTGISVGWTWGYGNSKAVGNIIERNHIHHIGKRLLSDMGGIYTLGISPGTVLRGNLIHDVESYSYGGWGIYFDEGSTDILAENNIVYNTKTGGFHQHYGKENVVRNNVFAFAKEGQIQRSRVEEHVSFTFEGNIVYWTQGNLFHGNWSGTNFRMDKNLYWNAADGSIQFPEGWKDRGLDAHSVVADPLFVNPEKFNFRLKPDSPAFKLGFKQIDRVGD